MNEFNVSKLLEYIPAADTTYTEWLQIGQALHTEGFPVDVWDEWSQNDSRYHPGECESKWKGFDASEGITGATITQMAKDRGWEPKRQKGHALDWTSTISRELQVVDHDWLEEKPIPKPANVSPVDQIIEYLNLLFNSSEHVGYVMEHFDGHDGRPKPTKGVYSKTAGDIISELQRYSKSYSDHDAIGFTLGDYDPAVGAWIRFNPLDGEGVSDSNVTDFRYALIESDSETLEKQYAIYQELELPIKALVHSGNKSLHAIVKINANSPQQYKERVNYLYDVVEKNGLQLDKQNRNASRLSRLPGLERNGKKQYIVAKEIGKETFDDWEDWIEAVNDDLPDPESLADSWDNMPDKAPELIQGYLRQGHKLLLSGPSKAGKSFALIELCIAIAEGKQWLGLNCAQGKVLYVNLELDRPSALHRFKDVYESLGYPPVNIDKIDIWNLRGKTAPLDKLAPKLIRRSEKADYIAVVIDPIYKVLTGDENSAEDMALFTNQFDKIATELGTAVIYCHHHSKGAQGGKKSMDRASGSGVFARDPDAILDLVELEVEGGLENVLKDNAVLEVYEDYFKKYNPDYLDEHVSKDDLLSVVAMDNHAKRGLSDKLFELGSDTIMAAQAVKEKSAWRVDATLREFAKPEPINMFFEYPKHVLDHTGLLKKAEPEHEKAPWQKAVKGKKSKTLDRKEERQEALEEAFETVAVDGKANIQDVAEALGKSDRTVRKHVNESEIFKIEDGFIFEENK